MIVNGVSDAHARACALRAEREMAEFQAVDAERFAAITAALAKLDIPPTRKIHYLRTIFNHPVHLFGKEIP